MAMSVFRTQEGSEIWDSKGNVKQHEIKYFVLSPDNKNAAIKAVLDDSPEIDYGLIRSSVRFDGFDDDGNAEITVIYEKEGLSGSFSSEESTVSFDCGTGTRHVTNAIRQWELWRKPNTSIPSPGKDKICIIFLLFLIKNNIESIPICKKEKLCTFTYKALCSIGDSNSGHLD